MILTITILALCLTVDTSSALSRAPPPCSTVNSVYVKTFLSNQFADQITGTYVLTTLTFNGFPVYFQDIQLTSTYLFVKTGGFLSLSMWPYDDPMIYLMPAEAGGTCFPPNSAWTFTSVGGWGSGGTGGVNITAGSEENDAIGPVVLKEPILPPDWCIPCKQVLDGPMAGDYMLAGWNDTRCDDGCLYWNIEGRHFCFEAGSYQVLLECPAHHAPANSTN